ncbi:MAG TPA: glycogen debranching N-terminal domain-containing protein [Nocardioidaceae bacterium]|nr:glycogen debranching N-terminal domain-containing protein [Nocardioidaceae bacterium]
MPPRHYQPFLHELVTLVCAPSIVLSPRSGQISQDADGCYWADRRVLSRLEVTVDGAPAETIDVVESRAACAQFLSAVLPLGDGAADPTVFVERSREVTADGLVEEVTLVSRARERVECSLAVRAGCDLAEIKHVKAGRTVAPLPADLDAGGWAWAADDGTCVRLETSPSADDVDEASGALCWRIGLGRGERFSVRLRLGVADDPLPLVGVATGGLLSEDRLRVHGHPELDAFLARSLDDLDALTVADPDAVDDRYVAAGAPWYLTLFGRDSLWAARMLLAAGTDLAGGTLRVLGRRQGTETDPEAAEEPGKILHEIRIARPPSAGRGGLLLPPVYYGTVDATPLWVLLLRDAWLWGMPEEQVRALMPVAERAMGWVRRAADSHGGFLAYRDETGHGLSNQGWKDSGDAIQFKDGRLADAPIALCEVQGYAHAAATAYASMTERLGLGDPHAPAGWRDWASRLADRFRAAYWIDDPDGAYPATALDAHGTRVDTVSSNIAHLLGTGLLDAAEEDLVVARLAGPAMDSGFGLRTLSTESSGFNPLSYHAGSVWTHDTAIAVDALRRVSGPRAAEAAGRLTAGIVEAARVFGWRVPELYGGQARAERPAPAPYPASCRPQAWSAASSVALLTAALGLEPDVPAGEIRVRALQPWPFGTLRVEGIRVAGERLDLTVDEAGNVSVDCAPSGLRVEV